MPKVNKHIEVKPSKYKTSLCQYYTKNLQCPYGERCVFAHGQDELQSQKQNIALLKSTGLTRLDKGLTSNSINTYTNDASFTAENNKKEIDSVCNHQSVSISDSDNDLSGQDSIQSSLCSQAGQQNRILKQVQKQLLLQQQEQQKLQTQTGQSSAINRQTLHSSARLANMMCSKKTGNLLRRRPVMVSLPKFDTTCETNKSPYQSNNTIRLRRRLLNTTSVFDKVSSTSNNNNNDNENRHDHYITHYNQLHKGKSSASSVITLCDSTNASYTAMIRAKKTPSSLHDAKSKHSSRNASQLNWRLTQCACAFSATCTRERPTVYRHNPYAIC